MTIQSIQHLSPMSVALRAGAGEDPGQIALEIDDRRVTYGQLNEQADRLAHRLVTELSGAEQRVVLRTSDTHMLAVGYLGIQRAGMIAVGLDPTAPPERVRTIVDDVEPALVLSDVDGDADIGLAPPTFGVWDFSAESDPVPTDRERAQLVSIVYTSGTTGQPKGIMMGREQKLEISHDEYGLQRGWRLGAMAAGTVAHAEALLSVLAIRGTLVAYEIRRHGIGHLAGWLQAAELDVCHLVPTVLRHVLPTLEPGITIQSLRRVILSGETATWEDVRLLRRILSPDAVIVNGFGQSETGSIAVMAIPSDLPAGQGALPAGRPLSHHELRILDPDGRPTAVGEPGEIVVRSPFVALGYWRRPELTRTTFRDLGDGVREVRTGDGGRLLPDGTLEHLGRIDHLVKISGNRVELAEVDAAVMSLAGVAAAAAGVFTDANGGTRLAACVIPNSDTVLDPRVLRAALARRLPGYMVPTRLTTAEALPRLPGGKLDRAGVADLPTIERARAGSDATPSGRLECALAAIWRELLSIEQIGRDDDFFALGGDSLGAAEMFVEIEDRLGIDRPVSLLAEAPTIASLAAALDDAEDPWSAPLAVWTAGARPPLFVIHDGIGSVLYARGLSDPLGADQPIYGVRCEALNGAEPAERSLEELARRYVEQMQGLYGRGPYVLYGASLGGVIALEMARQLLVAGTEVPLVVLGDSPLPGLDYASRRGKAAFHRRVMARMPPRVQARYLMRLITSELAWLFGEAGRTDRSENRQLAMALQRPGPVPAALRGRWVGRTFGSLLGEHEVRGPFPDRVLLLRTAGPGQLTDGGWGALLGEALRTADLSIEHRALSTEASGVHVGPVIRAELDRLASADLPEPPAA